MENGKFQAIKSIHKKMASPELIQKLENTIENIADFPIPEIQFKDISPIFADPALYKEVIEDLVKFSKGKSRRRLWN